MASILGSPGFTSVHTLTPDCHVPVEGGASISSSSSPTIEVASTPKILDPSCSWAIIPITASPLGSQFLTSTITCVADSVRLKVFKNSTHIVVNNNPEVLMCLLLEWPNMH
jgi:hypothetical protein